MTNLFLHAQTTIESRTIMTTFNQFHLHPGAKKMRYFSSKLRYFVPYIISISIGLNLLFFTLLIDMKQWQSRHHVRIDQTVQVMWPSRYGSYRVLSNFVTGIDKFNYVDSVTYTTHATPEYLHHVEELSDRWKGPVSVAVFTPGSDVNLARDMITRLIYCGKESVRKYVTFHLFFDENDSFYDDEFIFVVNSPINCEKTNETAKTYRHKKNITYPVNVARNVARVLANTYYVLASDLELFPCENFIEKFLAMVGRQIVTYTLPRVYVMPVFEVEVAVDPPKSKSELVKMFNEKKVITFHKHLCLSCHQIPDENIWLEKWDDGNMNVFKVVGTSSGWEPIFVGTNRDPFYDERLNWEGMKDKMSQMYEMCLMHYQLHILDNAFLVHAPGIKRDWKLNLNWRRPFMKNLTEINKQINAELLAKHPEKSTCIFK